MSTDTDTDTTVDQMRKSLEGLPRPKVKLTRVNGNAFSVMGTVSNALKKAGWTREQISLYTKISMSGDHRRPLRPDLVTLQPPQAAT